MIAAWVSLASAAIDGYCLVLEQDPVQKDVVWLGTEFGLYMTLDGGVQWHRWKHGLPACSAMALTTHVRDADLVIATHGRSLFVVDDLSWRRRLPSGCSSAMRLCSTSTRPSSPWRATTNRRTTRPGSPNSSSTR